MKDICRNILKEHNTGITNRQIAKNLGIHHNTVKYWLDKQGLTLMRELPWSCADNVVVTRRK